LAELPFVDEHAVDVDAPPERAWNATVAVSRNAFGGSGAGLFARVVGCDDTEVTGAPGAEGSTIVGFGVEAARPPQELVLAGRHRFSEYRLTFLVDALNGDRSRVRARTHARFPGLHGRAYRALVIGTRAHVLVVRRLLDAVKQRTRTQ
jgi:Protein of unknown function (DUF2867)